LKIDDSTPKLSSKTLNADFSKSTCVTIPGYCMEPLNYTLCLQYYNYVLCLRRLLLTEQHWNSIIHYICSITIMYCVWDVCYWQNNTEIQLYIMVVVLLLWCLLVFYCFCYVFLTKNSILYCNFKHYLIWPNFLLT